MRSFITPFVLVAIALSTMRCKQQIPPSVTKTVPTSTSSNANDASCSLDPAAVYADLMAPSGRFDGPARRYQDITSSDVSAACHDNARAGAKDETCKAYCDTCTSSLGHTANSTLRGALSAIRNGGVLVDILGKSAALEVLAARLALLFDFMNSKYGLDSKLQIGICGTTIIDIARILVSFKETGLGHSKVDKVTRLICGLNIAVNSCDSVPQLAVLVTPVKTALMSNPFVKGGSLAASITCAAGQFIADKMIKCPAFKRACKNAMENAQPIDNRSCCVCGSKHASTGQIVQYWGATVYGGSRFCERKTSEQLHNTFMGVPSHENLACEKREVDPNRTHGCSFYNVVYGHAISCNQDQKTYCLRRNIVSSRGDVMSAPDRPLHTLCDETLTPVQLIEKIQSYAPSRELTHQIDISRDIAEAPEIQEPSSPVGTP